MTSTPSASLLPMLQDGQMLEPTNKRMNDSTTFLDFPILHPAPRQMNDSTDSGFASWQRRLSFACAAVALSLCFPPLLLLLLLLSRIGCLPFAAPTSLSLLSVLLCFWLDDDENLCLSLPPFTVLLSVLQGNAKNAGTKVVCCRALSWLLFDPSWLPVATSAVTACSICPCSLHLCCQLCLLLLLTTRAAGRPA
jgi:hypothetical protein